LKKFICIFLKNIGINEKSLLKFRNERIKGNELYYLTDEDLDEYFGIVKVKRSKIKRKIEEIGSKNILEYTEQIYTDSNEVEVNNFLKKEILLKENIFEKFNDIDGQKLKFLNENDLIIRGLKLGKRRNILKFIPSINKPKSNQKKENVSKTFTVEEICLFLKEKFNLTE
jgi:hypothetical protein